MKALKIKLPNRRFVVERSLILGALLTFAMTAAFLITGLSRTLKTSIPCVYSFDSTPGAIQSQLLAVIHYATSRDVPQLTLPEIRTPFDVLLGLAPCNLLVFGLGHDSLMWRALNPRGTTFFLEEDARLVHTILARAPALRVHTVSYRTQLYEADHLLSSYRYEKHCLPPLVHLKGNVRCKLALHDMPDDVYSRNWDVILIDGPRGYYAEAPGRMAAIYSAAVMARMRSTRGATHVFLHDVDRKVEKVYAEEFLCKKYFVKVVGKLWHFRIPAGAYRKQMNRRAGSVFC